MPTLKSKCCGADVTIGELQTKHACSYYCDKCGAYPCETISQEKEVMPMYPSTGTPTNPELTSPEPSQNEVVRAEDLALKLLHGFEVRTSRTSYEIISTVTQLITVARAAKNYESCPEEATMHFYGLLREELTKLHSLEPRILGEK